MKTQLIAAIQLHVNDETHNDMEVSHLRCDN